MALKKLHKFSQTTYFYGPYCGELGVINHKF